MKTNLTLQWINQTPHSLENLTGKLYPYQDYRCLEPLKGEQQENQVVFSDLSTGSYLLSFRYELTGQIFDSCYFLFDTPDSELIQINILEKGAQFEQMGFFNEAGQFVDMLIYEGEKPFLTYLAPQDSFHYHLCHTLVFQFKEMDISQKKENLLSKLSDLSYLYYILENIWPYQLRMFIFPAILAKTTPEWKACLIQLVRTNPILMDNDKLYEILHEAVEMAQDSERVEFLLSLMEWDPDQDNWLDYPLFLEEISGKGVIKKRY